MGALRYEWRYSDHANAERLFTPLSVSPPLLIRWDFDAAGVFAHHTNPAPNPPTQWLADILAVAVVGGHMQYVHTADGTVTGRFVNFATTTDYKLLHFIRYE